jgi:hypothetical protein
MALRLLELALGMLGVDICRGAEPPAFSNLDAFITKQMAAYLASWRLRSTPRTCQVVERICACAATPLKP